MKPTRAAYLLVAASFMASTAGAEPWAVMGPRAMGMGGAQVAIAQGPEASYWNPGGLGQLYNTSGLDIPIGARFEFTGTVVQGAKDLYQVSQACQHTPLPTSDCTQANINQALSNLGQSGNGAMADFAGGVDVKIGRAVFFVNDTAYIGATPQVDLTNTSAATCPGGATCISNNQSKLILRGGIFTDIGLGYGHELWETGLVIGGNLKAIVGKIGYDQILLASKDPGNGAFSNFKDNSKTTVRPGIDVGALWDMRETMPWLPMRPRLGIVGRNVNNPTFSQPAAATSAGDTGRYSLHGQTRVGGALSPFKWWHFAADIDLTNNITPIDGYKSRYLSFGTEINVFNRPWLNVPLRAGLQKNVAQGSGSALSYTAGFGFNFLHVMLDVAGMISADRTQLQTIDNNRRIPTNAAASARFAFLFGGEDAGVRNK